jgi:alpha-glucosidase (family GH31 glycosyl hydrolase)
VYKEQSDVELISIEIKKNKNLIEKSNKSIEANTELSRQLDLKIKMYENQIQKMPDD